MIIREIEQQFLEEEVAAEQEPELEPEAPKLISLDIVRGLCMFGIILVEQCGPSPPWFLKYSQWDGLTPADLFSPSFIFIMGMEIPLAITRQNPINYRKICRVVFLFLLGIFLNLLFQKFQFNNLRIPGMLQRLSLCYMVILIIHCITKYDQRNKRLIGAVLVFFTGVLYLVLMMSWKSPEAGCDSTKILSDQCNLSGYIDRNILSKEHILANHYTDPQGLFSSLNALVTCYTGYYFCLIMKEFRGQPFRILGRWVFIVLLVGAMIYPLTLLIPFNKNLYTTSFTFATVWVIGLSLGAVYLLVEVIFYDQFAREMSLLNVLFRPFLWLGRNPLFIFVLMDGLVILMKKYISVSGKTLFDWFYGRTIQSWIQDKQLASALYSIFFICIGTFAAGLLHSKRIFIIL